MKGGEVNEQQQQLLRSHVLDQRRRGLQESTIGNRYRLLCRFADWLGSKPLLEATTEDIEQFLDGRKLGRKGRYTSISNLHVFYEWAVFSEHTRVDPTARVVRPKLRLGLPRPITDVDLRLALDMARGDIKAMLCLAAYQGMRCIEIARLVRADVLDDRDPPVVIARGKGDKPRIIPMHPLTWEALRLLPLPRTGPVLHDDLGRPLPPWKVSQEGNVYLHGIGLDATMHQLRHWFGTTLYRTSGKDLLLVRDLMGHSSITTTTIYAAFDREGAAEAVSLLGVSRGQPPTMMAAGGLGGQSSGGALSPHAGLPAEVGSGSTVAADQ